MSGLPTGTVILDAVSKRYRLGSLGTLRSTVAALTSRSGNREREFWALKDVSFSVKPGESLGLIGPNGSGKTTTLRLLSSITQPTCGQIDVGGRMSSLIELGAGFHPELSGRDNIFLNGAILGLRRQEIRRQFDAIVAFSELERFIDTPVKRYSSGMYVRLGFAVAAHVEPNVLLIDEVLAVGDASFRQKCIQRMNSLKENGTTLLFVSHNMHLVRSLCQRSILLWNGELAYLGSTADAIQAYERKSTEASASYVYGESRNGLTLRGIDLKRGGDGVDTEFVSGDRITMACGYIASNEIVDPVIRVRLFRNDGYVVAMLATHHQNQDISTSLKTSGEITLTFSSLDVLTGHYFFEIRVMDPTDSEVLSSSRSAEFYISSPGFGYEIDRGVYYPDVKWGVS